MAQKIIFTAPYSPSFVRQDIELLRKTHQVITDILPWQKKWLYPILIIIQFGKLLIHIPTCKAIFCSFGGYWCLVPTLLGKFFSKPVYIILHGTDCCKAPKIDYGALRKSLVKKACQFSYSKARKLLPVSKSLMRSNDGYSSLVGPQGVQTHFPNIVTEHQVVPNGVDCTFWDFSKEEKRPIQFITVMDKKQFLRRDGNSLIGFFRNNSNCNLTIVGSVPKDIDLPKNITIKPWMKSNELKALFCSSNYYIQLSLYEGFGCSMTEAMACGCIPIGTKVNAVSDIIGDTGLVIEQQTQVATEISAFLTSEITEEMQISARNRIKNQYNLSQRETAFNQLIASIE